MKSNLRRKLFMSLAATAACAATLTSTTFAWYTSNSSVTTDSVNAATESSVDTGSIYIAAATGYNADKVASFTNAVYSSSAEPLLVSANANKNVVLKPVYYNGEKYLPQGSAVDKYVAYGSTSTAPEGGQVCYTVTPTDANITDSTSYGAVQGPLYYKSGDNYVKATGYVAGETYYTLAATETTVTGGGSLSGKYSLSKKSEMTYKAEAVENQMEFVYRLRTANAGTATPVYFKDFEVKNTTYAPNTTTLTLPTQTALVYNVSGGLNSTGVDGAGSYSVDFLHALKMTMTVTPMSDADTLDSTNAVTKIYNFDSMATAGTHTTAVSATSNAIGYYNAAVGANIEAPSTYNSGDLAEVAVYATTGENHTNKLQFEIPTTGYVEVRFVFWLDGWDEYCYDTCLLQSFQFSTNFTVNSDEATGAFVK